MSVPVGVRFYLDPTSPASVTIQAEVIGKEGPPGPAASGGGNAVVDPDAENRLQNRQTGLFVPPVGDGELPDMTLIFENALL